MDLIIFKSITDSLWALKMFGPYHHLCNFKTFYLCEMAANDDDRRKFMYTVGS